MAEQAARRTTDSLADAAPRPFWLDDPDRPAPLPPLLDDVHADLVVVGGGYTGLWTALRALEREPGCSVVLLEAGACGHEASGRNGGFAAASLTHGFGNGLQRWPEELDVLDRLGAENLTAIGESIARYGIDCGFTRSGELTAATSPHQGEELAALGEAMRAAGHDVVTLSAEETRKHVDSPTYVAGLLDREGTALLEPARLAWGLRAACLAAGARIFEGTPAVGLERDGAGVRVRTARGAVVARHAALATNAFPSLLRRLRPMTVPVYDHVLMTEPLTTEQLDSIGWAGREGLADAGNLFHYARLTRDDRLLWGGYDAVYHWRGRIDRSLEQGPTHALLADQLVETFPGLAEVRFSHRWGGVIDTCTRFSAFFGTALGGRVGYAVGYTGLGVAASRFGADVVLDLLRGEESRRTSLRMVRERPLPFPPEPVRWAGITATRHALASADRNGGRRNWWLRALDRTGLGFDS